MFADQCLNLNTWISKILTHWSKLNDGTQLLDSRFEAFLIPTPTHSSPSPILAPLFPLVLSAYYANILLTGSLLHPIMFPYVLHLPLNGSLYHLLYFSDSSIVEFVFLVITHLAVSAFTLSVLHTLLHFSLLYIPPSIIQLLQFHNSTVAPPGSICPSSFILPRSNIHPQASYLMISSIFFILAHFPLHSHIWCRV